MSYDSLNYMCFKKKEKKKSEEMESSERTHISTMAVQSKNLKLHKLLIWIFIKANSEKYVNAGNIMFFKANCPNESESYLC